MFRWGVLIAAMTVPVSVYAGDVPAEIQVQLQSAMQTYIDDITDDGAYTFVDEKNSSVKTVYPANVHPMVLDFGDDYFMCSELVDENGTNITADFLVRKIGDDYRVVQMILDNRPIVLEAMSKIKR